MADSSRTIMTDAGFALETRVRADETKMQFTRAAISTDDHFSDTDDALAKLTELYNIQQDGKVTAVQVINTTTVYVQVDVNQAESKADYQMRSAALYAKDDDGTEVLYGVTVLQDPVFVHKDADGSYLGFGINTTVGKASNVVVVVDPANMVTQQVFEGTMKNYYTKAEVDAKFVTDDDFASKLPKNIATTDAANTFAKSQTLAGGATDGKGNAYATTKDVATGLKNGFNTKVNVSDMRKPASDVAGIEEVNAKADASAVDQLKTNLTNQVSTLQTQVDNSAVGTNLLTNSNFSSGLGNFTVNSGTNSDCKAVVTTDSDGDTCVHITGTGAYCGLYCSPVSFNQNQVTTGSTLVKGTGKCNLVGLPNRPGSNFGTISTESYSKVGTTVQAASGTNAFCAYFDPVNGVVDIYIKFAKLELSSHATDWCPNPLEILTKADDSKVAHLSGANNFDTVPTVNNNPLLLASSLPSDLARTGQDANFTGKLQQNGQDVALANNTIARNPDTGRATDTTDFPYKGLTVDGYPIIPLVLVPDRATAITKTAQYPNYAFMYGKELS